MKVKILFLLIRETSYTTNYLARSIHIAREAAKAEILGNAGNFGKVLLAAAPASIVLGLGASKLMKKKKQVGGRKKCRCRSNRRRRRKYGKRQRGGFLSHLYDRLGAAGHPSFTSPW